jgi:hypothetical protein
MHEFTFYMAEVSIEVFTKVMIHIVVSRDVTPCSLVRGYRPYTLKPSRWGQHIPPKYQHYLQYYTAVKTQKTTFWTVIFLENSVMFGLLNVFRLNCALDKIYYSVKGEFCTSYNFNFNFNFISFPLIPIGLSQPKDIEQVKNTYIYIQIDWRNTTLTLQN